MKKNGACLLPGLLLFLIIFLGCTSLRKEPVQKDYFDLNISLPVSGHTDLGKDTLMVKDFVISPAFDTPTFVYCIAKNEYVTDYYNEFINYPAKLITEEITQALFSSGCFSPALSGTKQGIDYRLSGNITRLYGNFQDKGSPKAVVEIRMILEKKTDKNFQIVLNSPYLMEEPISTNEPSQLVAGWNKGLSKIATQFISDFKSLSP